MESIRGVKISLVSRSRLRLSCQHGPLSPRPLERSHDTYTHSIRHSEELQQVSLRAKWRDMFSRSIKVQGYVGKPLQME
jgi:hypothetical protein